MDYFTMLSPKSEYNEDYYSSALAKKLKGGDAPIDDASYFVFDITSELTQFIYVSKYNITGGTVTVDWGDGTVETSSNISPEALSHKYRESGLYTVKITGDDGKLWSPGGGFYESSVIKNYSFLGDVSGKSPSYPTLISAVMGANSTLDNTRNFAFSTGLKSAVISDKSEARKLTGYCFRNCSALEIVTLSNKISTIGEYAFLGCNSLHELILLNPVPPYIGSDASIYGLPDNCLIKVPAGSVEAYKTASVWSTRSNYIQAI